MTDLERILMTIIDRMTSTMLLDRPHNGTGPYVDFSGNVGAQFVSSRLVAPKAGSIVLCRTGRVGPWKIARFVEECADSRDRYGHYLLREIGTSNLCNMENEELWTLVGIDETALFEGAQQSAWEASKAAFSEEHNDKAAYLVRWGGTEFDGDTMRVWVRPHIWAQDKREEGKPTLYAQPWSIEMKWSSETTASDVVKALLDAGFPREWEWSEKRPEQGMAGCMTVTRDGLIGMLKHGGHDTREGYPLTSPAPSEKE